MLSQSPSFNPTNLELIYHKLSGEWPFGGPDITFFDDLTAAHKQLITGVINFEWYMAKRVAAEEKFIRDQEGWFDRVINWNEIPVIGFERTIPHSSQRGAVLCQPLLNEYQYYDGERWHRVPKERAI